MTFPDQTGPFNQAMNSMFPFKFFRPSFCAGLLDDPLLLLRFKSKNNNVLVDCGHLNHLAKRVLKSLKAVFISHAHMDHFIGFDSFARSILVSGKTIEVFGPEGIAKRIEGRLKAYSWNLTEAYYCSFRIHEICPNTTKIFFLDGAREFSLFADNELERQNSLIFESTAMTVEAGICDHKIPVVIYKFTEKPIFEVSEEKIAARGLKKGAWVNELKELEVVNLNTSQPSKLEAQTLYDSIKKESDTASIGYITDVGFTPDNIRIITDLMKNLTLLVCECTYLKENKKKARDSYHLCTDDVNHLLEMLRPTYFLPMHLSKTYLYHSEEFYQQLALPKNCQLIKLPERISLPPLLPKDIDFNKMN